MPAIKVDAALCQGYGNCVIGAEDVFDIGDDGIVIALVDQVAESERQRIDQAAGSCPVAAVWLDG